MELLVLGLFLLVASVCDIRTREVPDWLSYSLIVFGLASALFYSWIFSDWYALVASIIGFGACFLLGLLMFYTGQWGGGDAKLVMGIGATLGLPWQNFPILVVFLIMTLFVGSFYGVFYGFFLVVRNFRRFRETLKTYLCQPRVLLLRRVVVVFSAFLLILSFWLPGFLRFSFWALIVVFLSGYYLIIFMKVLEKACLIKELPIAKLTEGDWIYKDVVVQGKRICGPKDLGISKDQIALLKRLRKQGKISAVTVKEGVPFVPSFFLAYILTMWKGAWLVKLFF